MDLSPAKFEGNLPLLPVLALRDAREMEPESSQGFCVHRPPPSAPAIFKCGDQGARPGTFDKLVRLRRLKFRKAISNLLG